MTRLYFLAACLAVQVSVSAETRFELLEGDRVALLGDGFLEREQYEGWIELAATTFATLAGVPTHRPEPRAVV